MARFSSIIYGCVLVLAATATQGQTARPAQMNGQAPFNGQYTTNQQQPMRQGTPAPNEVPQTRQQQQMGQQQQQPQAARPVDPPANTPPPPDTPLSPPVVNYHDGMLTVQALNSTLSSVVAAIKSKTGIEFEGFDNSPDRVAISLGPAPSGEVLSAIFAGSKFDFVAIGRPDSPDVVQRVILSPRKAPGGGTLAAQRPQAQNGGENDEEDTPDETVNAGDPQDTAVQPPPEQAQQPNQQNQQPSQPKTPEQLMQELQEMQKQQQQQQQGAQNPAQVPRKQPPL